MYMYMYMYIYVYIYTINIYIYVGADIYIYTHICDSVPETSYPVSEATVFHIFVGGDEKILIFFRTKRRANIDISGLAMSLKNV